MGSGVEEPRALESGAAVTTISKGMDANVRGSFVIQCISILVQNVIPWKGILIFRNVFIQHAELAEIHTGALEDRLFLEHQERLCHGDERKSLQEKIMPWELLIADILIHSHVSRYWATVIALACRKLMTCFFLLETSCNGIVCSV
ncbi:LOW QUALITY PROTEIN: sperm-associated microtubule inner protein 10 [Gavia stellata]|uniref:LOW QUALITY PROTEIN: sperm-associated microtubule inner protein 10 n=1 Tax=Gavia stellata TaxID=37040 RepID=UPI00289FF435|nr:LOW QUALITY PROTEIN: sperm-associated microtubule inner protein 10 [Gavia stellata]